MEKRRLETLSDIDAARVNVKEMAQRPRSNNTDKIDDEHLKTVLACFTEIETKAKAAARIEDLGKLEADAEQQEQHRAYFCPITDIHDEGEIVIGVIEGWGVPKTAIEHLRKLFRKSLIMRRRSQR